MIVTRHNLLNSFYKYNKEYFDNELPLPELIISNGHRTLGYFKCQLNDYGEMFGQVIEISGNYDYTEEQFRDILVHEMIHYYLMYSGEDTKCHHGKAFNRMAIRFNVMYGMNITPTIDLTPYKLRDGKSKLWHKICTFF